MNVHVFTLSEFTLFPSPSSLKGEGNFVRAAGAEIELRAA